MSIKYHQQCYQSPSKEAKALPCSSPASAKKGYDKGSFFTYRGEDTGYFYTAAADRLSIFKSNGYIEDATLSFSIPFGPTATVIDCIYFPLNETSPGVVVAVRDTSLTHLKHKFYLAYVSLTKKRVLKKIAAPHGDINSLANIIDGAQYPSQVHGLNSAFQKNWPHIIGVSLHGIGAALTHLGMTSEDDEHGEQCHKPPNVIVLAKTFLAGEDSFFFQDDLGRSIGGPRSNFFVSKFAFIERCAIVVMGFPFGGIYMVSLRTQRPFSFFMAEGVIEDIAIQDADDDPRGFFYLWFALSRGEKAHALSAYAIFPDEEEKRQCYDNPQFTFSLNFTLLDFMSFLSVKTMLVDRSRLAGSPKDGDASANDSVVANNKSSSLALFTWLSSTKPTRIYGALFDLNMFYFKRTPTRLNPDDTELKQIPFCSGFQTDDSVDVKNLEIYDISIMPNSLRAFVSIENEDKDQLFYPSVYAFTLKTLTRDKSFYLNVDSIHDQYLREVSKNFREHWSNPSNACTKFHALGIGALPYESNDKRFYQLSTLLKHAYHFCIIDFIMNDDTPITDLKFILKWLNKEIEVNKESLDRFCHPLLRGEEVSHTSMQFIKFSEYFFYRICQIFDALIERVEKNEQEEMFLKQLKVTASVANGIHLYSIGIKFGLTTKMLPQFPSSITINQNLKNIFTKQMHNNDKGTLSIIRLIQECMDSTSESSVWGNKSPQEWYPPHDYATWLGLFLMVNLSKTAKATLFGYYLYDLVKKGLCHDEKLLDKGLGYFLLTDNEKGIAIKRRIERMYKSDEQLSKADTDYVLENIVNDMKNPQSGHPSSLSEYYDLPIMSQNQVDIAKEYFFKLPNGIHYWNKSVIEKRRFELIETPNPPNGNESSEIKEIRENVIQIQRQMPWLFRKNRLFSVVKQWVDEENNPKETYVPRKVDVMDVTVSRKRTIDEVIDAEEEAFNLATPIKQGRKSLFADTPAAKAFREFENGKSSPSENDITMSPVVNKDIDNRVMTDKQWEKIKLITKTPPATPLVSRSQISPEPSAIKQPTSILKSNKKQSKITSSTKRIKLQFDVNLSQIKSIPNRHEQRTPLPDAFTTMDESMLSEKEQQQIDDDDDKANGADLSYGPVKLNFDFPEEISELPSKPSVEPPSPRDVYIEPVEEVHESPSAEHQSPDEVLESPSAEHQSPDEVLESPSPFAKPQFHEEDVEPQSPSAKPQFHEEDVEPQSPSAKPQFHEEDLEPQSHGEVPEPPTPIGEPRSPRGRKIKPAEEVFEPRSLRIRKPSAEPQSPRVRKSSAEPQSPRVRKSSVEPPSPRGRKIKPTEEVFEPPTLRVRKPSVEPQSPRHRKSSAEPPSPRGRKIKPAEEVLEPPTLRVRKPSVEPPSPRTRKSSAEPQSPRATRSRKISSNEEVPEPQSPRATRSRKISSNEEVPVPQSPRIRKPSVEPPSPRGRKSKSVEEVPEPPTLRGRKIQRVEADLEPPTLRIRKPSAEPQSPRATRSRKISSIAEVPEPQSPRGRPRKL